MSEFDEWFKNEMPNSHKKVGKEKIETVIYSCTESAWNHKQAEVDELRKNFNNALKTIEIQQRFLDDADGANRILTSQASELQKRIDDLKAFCIKGVESNMLSIEYNQALIDMYKILKGEQL